MRVLVVARWGITIFDLGWHEQGVDVPSVWRAVARDFFAYEISRMSCGSCRHNISQGLVLESM